MTGDKLREFSDEAPTGLANAPGQLAKELVRGAEMDVGCVQQADCHCSSGSLPSGWVSVFFAATVQPVPPG